MRFKKIMEARGWEVTKSNIYDDVTKHIDFYLKDSKNKMFSVDVKAPKRVCRYFKTSNTHTWLEVHGNHYNSKGWLFGGKNDLIAFETVLNKFIVVRRDKLAAKFLPISNKLFNERMIERNPAEAVKKGYIYRRDGFQGVLWVKISDFKDCMAREFMT